LAKLNAPTTEIAAEQVATTGIALFGEVAKMYRHGYLGRENQIAKPTRAKEEFYLTEYIIPKWGGMRLNQIHPKALEDWLHTTFGSWWPMHGVRAIMSRIFYYAEGHGLWEEGKRSPASKAKLGKKQLGCLYALLDRSASVRIEHLKAAAAVWRYCEASAHFVFGNSTGDKAADEILQALRATPTGLTRTELRDHF
jgi:hypothetical protein